MDFIGIAMRGFENWKAKEHNARWFRKIDGTPIPNDLPVCIGQAFADAEISDDEIEMAVGGSYELPDGRKFWIDRQAALEITRRVRAAINAAT